MKKIVITVFILAANVAGICFAGSIYGNGPVTGNNSAGGNNNWNTASSSTNSDVNGTMNSYR